MPGIAGVLVFYAAVLGVGVWAATKKRKKNRSGQDDMILANRGLGLVLGVFTLIGEFSTELLWKFKIVQFEIRFDEEISEENFQPKRKILSVLFVSTYESLT